MIVRFRVCYVVTLFLIWIRSNQFKELQTLNYALLNYEETITLNLENYFQNPSRVSINQYNSTTGITDILNIHLTEKPVSNISSIPLSARLSDNTTADFNNYTVVMERSVYNHPNKVFLMNDNMVFSLRYKISNSDNHSYIQAFKVTNNSSNCTQLEVQQFNSSYYLFVACLYPNGDVTIYPYKFNQFRSVILSDLVPLNKMDLKLTNCSKIILYSFSQLYIGHLFRNKVLLFCACNTILNLRLSFILSMINNKGMDLMHVDRFADFTLSNCLNNSQLVVEYQKGFLALTGSYLKYYSYNPATYKTSCINFFNVSGYKFLASVEEREIQYVYVLFDTIIMIKESYSPNFQLVNIDQTAIVGMTLDSYSIDRQFLALLYVNQTDYCLLMFDLRTSYPKLLDILNYPRNFTSLKLQSVENFLEKGNYFVLYDSIQNVFNLKLYIGYELTISIKNSALAIGEIVLMLFDKDYQSLLLNMTFRDFTDLTLQKATNMEKILFFQDVLNMNLANYVNGPLGRFYNYPNSLSAFQYINYQSEMSIGIQLQKVKENLMAISINNQLSKPIMTFYFSGKTVLTCELIFALDARHSYLSQCNENKIRKNTIEIPFQMIVLVQEGFVQFNDHTIEHCQLSVSGDYQCSVINVSFQTEILQVRVASYSYSDREEDISLIVFGKKQIVYCQLQRLYPSRIFSVSINYHIKSTNLPELAQMSIVDLQIDNGYTHFLVLRLVGDIDQEEKVIVYDKPFILQDSSSTLIGHVIEVFEKIKLEAMFCVSNLLVLVTQERFSFNIREYTIGKEYRLRFNRAYPLYGYQNQVKVGGRHFQDQNFLFLEVFQEETSTSYYLVYAPLLSSCNLLTHRIPLPGAQIIFAQQIEPISNSSLVFLGAGKIVGVTLPNLVFKFTRGRSSTSMTLCNFNVSVVDSLNQLNILNYQFSYNELQEQIQYLNPDDLEINLGSSNQTEFYIDAQNIFGIVADYNLSVPQVPSCNQLKIQRRDLFTKQQCLLYYQTLQYGTLTDFLAIFDKDVEIELIVTDSSLFCVKNKMLPLSTNSNFSNLTDCIFATNKDEVLMTCINSSTLSRQIFNITVTQTMQDCSVFFSLIAIPDQFTYQDFDLQFSNSYIVFQVPIRLGNNKIYYKAKFQSNMINNNYSLLRRQLQADVYQSEFQSTDSSISDQLFLLLEDGIGIFNLSDSNATILPALWVSSSELAIIVENQSLAYIKYIILTHQGLNSVLLIELGTTWKSMQLEIVFQKNPNSSNEQTVYDLIEVNRVFKYQQYVNCRNSAHSQSQSFENLIVKICDYEPIDYSVFANFISISNDTNNSLIQFYNRSGTSSFPFRIEVIYSNTISNHDFVIRRNTMVVGSLFNMLCYYSLIPTFSWIITNNSSDTDEECVTNLTIFNKQNAVNKTIRIIYDGDINNQDYWSIGILYIQRVIILAILGNTLRLILCRSSETHQRYKRKESSRLYSSRFQVMVKINSKRSL